MAKCEYTNSNRVNIIPSVSRILVENKEILASKKKAYADQARQINTTKQEIDITVAKLNKMKEEREAQGMMF